MASLLGGATLVADVNFQRRVGMAMYFVAREVYTESPEVPHHPLRVALAQRLLNVDIEDVLRYAAMIVTAPTIVAKTDQQLSNHTNVTDNEIIGSVREVWNPLSGVM